MKFEHVLPPKVEIVDRERYILQAVAGKRVLHLACVDSGLLNERLLDDKWLHKKIVDEGQVLVGLDDDAGALKKSDDIGNGLHYLSKNFYKKRR